MYLSLPFADNTMDRPLLATRRKRRKQAKPRKYHQIETPKVSYLEEFKKFIQKDTEITKKFVQGLEQFEQYISKTESGYCCKLCNKTVRDKTAARNHVEALHIPSQGYNCENCEKGFKTKNALWIHVSRAHRSTATQPGQSNAVDTKSQPGQSEPTIILQKPPITNPVMSLEATKSEPGGSKPNDALPKPKITDPLESLKKSNPNIPDMRDKTILKKLESLSSKTNAILSNLVATIIQHKYHKKLKFLNKNHKFNYTTEPKTRIKEALAQAQRARIIDTNMRKQEIVISKLMDNLRDNQKDVCILLKIYHTHTCNVNSITFL